MTTPQDQLHIIPDVVITATLSNEDGTRQSYVQFAKPSANTSVSDGEIREWLAAEMAQHFCTKVLRVTETHTVTHQRDLTLCTPARQSQSGATSAPSGLSQHSLLLCRHALQCYIDYLKARLEYVEEDLTARQALEDQLAENQAAMEQLKTNG